MKNKIISRNETRNLKIFSDPFTVYLFVKSIVQIIFFSQSIRSSIVSIILLLLPILLFVRRYSLLFHNVIFHFILFHYSFPVYFYFLSNGFIVARFYQRPLSKRNEIKKMQSRGESMTIVKTSAANKG